MRFTRHACHSYAVHLFIDARPQCAFSAARAELPEAEVARYEEQQRYIARIVALYNSDPDNFTELFALIQQVRICGARFGFCLCADSQLLACAFSRSA